MLTNRLLRTAVPIALTALALTACGPEDDAGPAATQKGTFAEPLALKTSAEVSETHFPDQAKTQLSVTPVSVVKGDKAAVEKLGVGLLEGKTPYYVTTTYAHKGGAPDSGSFNFKLLLHGTDQQRAYFFAPAWGPRSSPARRLPRSSCPWPPASPSPPARSTWSRRTCSPRSWASRATATTAPRATRPAPRPKSSGRWADGPGPPHPRRPRTAGRGQRNEPMFSLTHASYVRGGGR